MEQSFRALGRAAVLAAVVALAGCMATVGPAYGPAYPAPDLVTISPGVSVIADYDEPIFFSSGFYWRFYGGGWYRSPYYTRGWVHATPPGPIMRINQPWAYRHYRPPGWRGYAARPQPVPATGAWRSGPVRGPAPVTRPLAAPGPRRPAAVPNRASPRPQQGRPAPAPSRSSGWRGTPPPPPR